MYQRNGRKQKITEENRRTRKKTEQKIDYEGSLGDDSSQTQNRRKRGLAMRAFALAKREYLEKRGRKHNYAI
jgi:hypothetical protein